MSGPGRPGGPAVVTGRAGVPVYQGSRPLPADPAPSAALLRRFPPRPGPVGLEYTIVEVTCSLLAAVWGCQAAIWYSCVSPPRTCFRRIRVRGEVDLRRPGVSLSRCDLAEGAVRPGCVVVAQVFGQHPAQVILIDDQQPVEQFPAQGADHPFADRVRSLLAPVVGWRES